MKPNQALTTESGPPLTNDERWEIALWDRDSAFALYKELVKSLGINRHADCAFSVQIVLSADPDAIRQAVTNVRKLRMQMERPTAHKRGTAPQ
jgi:hypothetical protein